MPEQKAIILECESGIGDQLEVMSTDDTVEVVACHSRGDAVSIFLNETDARALFNWLGVWLHTSGGS